MTPLIRILIADDHYVVRKGLAAMLVAHHQMEVIGEATTGREAVEMARTLKPDVIVMDMVMPDLDGAEATELIKQENSDTRIVILAGFGQNTRVMAAVQAGALGYVLKDSPPEDLLHAIRSVYRGTLSLPRDLALTLVHPSPRIIDVDQLTERELDVLRLLAQGQSNREIAAHLSISVTTVRSHVSSILLKLNVANRTQAALHAREQQLV